MTSYMVGVIKRVYACMSCYKGDVEFSHVDITKKKIPVDIYHRLNMENIHELESVEWSNTIPFIPSVHYGKVIKVYDGDTITIASKMPYPDSPIFRFSVRLNGIDTPEIKGKTVAEKKHATLARDALSEQILGKIVELKNVSLEKYGRLLADVYCKDLHLNKWLIDNKYAVPYDGGTKSRPNDWDLNE